MNGAGRGAPGSYARAVERLWSGLCGRAVILSQKDWSIIEEWHARGIALQIIEEAVAAAAARRKRGRQAPPPRGLAYIAQAVEEGWMAVLEGRRQLPQAGSPEEEAPAISSWRERMEAEGRESALGLLLSDLIAAYDRGGRAVELDALLDAGLAEALPEELKRDIATEVRRELAPYRERMAPAAYESTLRRAITVRLRDKLKLDRLPPL